MSVPELLRLWQLAEGKRVLEIGAKYGASTVIMAQSAALVVSVDWHRGDPQSGESPTLAQYMVNLHRYGVIDRVAPVIANIEAMEGVFSAMTFDLVLVDALHTYEAVKADIGRFGHLAPVRAFHDYNRETDPNPKFPEGFLATFGVTRAVDEAYGKPGEVVDYLAIVT